MKAVSEQGERLNIRKATLREWRGEFARHLRDQGIAANATERAVRGESRTHKKDGIYRAAQRADSTHFRTRAEAVASELLTGKFLVEPGKSKLMHTRKAIERGWRAAELILASQGRLDLAADVKRFVRELQPPLTEREYLATQLKTRLQDSRARGPVR